MDQINALADKIEKKATKSDINASEEGFIYKFQGYYKNQTNVLKLLLKKWLIKMILKKLLSLIQALLFLEKRINDLYSMSFEKKPSPEDDPLGAKRPMFWSCLSCDIDVDKVILN